MATLEAIFRTKLKFVHRYQANALKFGQNDILTLVLRY